MRRIERRAWRIVLLRGALIVWFCALIAISICGLSLLAYNAHYKERIFEGVSIAGLDVGGLLPGEALARLPEWVGSHGLPYVSLRTAGQDWTLSSEDLGGYLDLHQALDDAWSLGRSGVFRRDLKVRLALLWWHYDLVPEFHIEPAGTLIYLRQVARQAGHPARRAQLWVAGLQARAGESQAGRELDVRATAAAVEAQVRQALGGSSWGTASLPQRLLGRYEAPPHPFPMEPIPVRIVFREIVPPITEVAGAEERAALILSGPLTLSSDLAQPREDGGEVGLTRRWRIDRATLASWLIVRRSEGEDGAVMRVEVDRDRIRAWLLALAEEINCPSREPRHDYDPSTGQLSALLPGQNGYNLDIEAAQALVAEACVSLQRHVALPVRVVRPRVSRADLESMLPLALIAEGESSFKGSKPARLRNIRIATKRFHGLAVAPGATFSFLKHLGLVTVANGYSESWIIYGDRTILGPGGGVCQVSTTCYRAAFWAGFPIVERRAHTYRVSWYEPPIGLDAAVFAPSVDFKFQNDTDSPILILTEVDQANAKLYFRFYGRPPDRKVTMEGPVTANPVKAGEPVVEVDPSLAPGARVQIDWPHDGIDVTLYRVIQREGEQAVRQEFFTRYEPWPARYHVGPSR